jgi:hypothetical protein
LAEQGEIDDVALSMNVSHAELSIGSPGCREEPSPEFFRIALTDSN